jgi:plastocyanin
VLKKTLLGVLAAGTLLLGTSTAFAQMGEEDPFLVPIAGAQFLKPELVVPVGTTVTWLNLDEEQHNVVERFNLLFESPLINPGEAWMLTFDVPGVFDYVCDLHANQEGVVVVLAAAAMDEGAAEN